MAAGPLAGVTSNLSVCWACWWWESLSLRLGRLPRLVGGNQLLFNDDAPSEAREGKKKKVHAAALQALRSEAAAMRWSPKLSLRSSGWEQHLMICCDVVSGRSSRLDAACVDRNRKNWNKLVAVFSHIVTVANLKLDGSLLFYGLQLKIIFIHN